MMGVCAGTEHAGIMIHNNLQPVAQDPSSHCRMIAQAQTEHRAMWEACTDAAHLGT